MADFELPTVNKRTDGWGPPSDLPLENCTLLGFSIEQLEKFPIQKIGRVCDFTLAGQRWAEQRVAKGKSKGKGQALGPVKKDDDEGFSLVNHKVLTSKGTGRGRFSKGKAKGRSIADNYQEGILGSKQKPGFQTTQSKGKSGKAKGRGGVGRGGRSVPTFKEWSVPTRTEWTMKREIFLSSLPKLQVDARNVEYKDLMWCGQLHEYNREFDRITVRTERQLTRFEESRDFFNVTTSEDPILPDLLQNDPTATVIATDHVLACLVAAARSSYSWDIVITKISNRLIFDKRQGSQIDFWSVNETAPEPPNSEDRENINSAQKLSREATIINWNFSQMALDSTHAPEQMPEPTPFEDEGEVASGAWRYRKITIPGNPKDEVEFNQQPVSIIVRTEVNAKGIDNSLISLKALNEYIPKVKAEHNSKVNYFWRTHLESQRGAVFANELKNNGFKLGRWTAQAILAGCDTMKVGYASRMRPDDAWHHSILGVQTSFTDKLAEQIGMHHNNMFGILRTIIDLLMSWEDGKYLLMKDPTKPVLRIYEIPWDTFADEEGTNEEEEEPEGEDLDDDGNVVPSVAGSALMK